MHPQTPLHAITAAAGATFGEEDGWLLPRSYGDERVEYGNASQDVAVFDVSHRGYVEARGADAGRFLHNLCTNEILKLSVGAGCEAFLTTGQAKIVAYVLIYHAVLPGGIESYLMDAGPAMGERVVQHLDRFLISEQVELANRTSDFAQLHIAGPRAQQVLESLIGADLAGFEEYGLRFLSIGGISCELRRHAPLGLPGFDIVVTKDHAPAVWHELAQAGVKPAGSQAYEMLRVEAGTPVYGRDIDETNLPQEVARVDRTISFTKGCYIGQETVARIRTYGHVNRSLVGLKFSQSASVARGAKLLRDGKDVGNVTSSVISPRLGAAIGLAYVRRGSQEPGTMLEVEGQGSACQAEVTSLPFASGQA